MPDYTLDPRLAQMILAQFETRVPGPEIFFRCRGHAPILSLPSALEQQSRRQMPAGFPHSGLTLLGQFTLNIIELRIKTLNRSRPELCLQSV